MGKRKVTGHARHADGTPWGNAYVSFQLWNFSYTASTIYPRDRVSTFSDAAGNFEIELWTNQEGHKPCEYVCRLPSNEEFRFVLPPGDGDIDLPTLLGLGQPAELNQTLLTLLDDRIAEQTANVIADSIVKANRIQGIAAIDLSGQRAVRLDSNGKATYADNADLDSASALGITAHAALAESNVEIVTFREFAESSWNWIPGRSVFLGENGFLTQTPPEVGVLLPIAKALSPTEIFINIQSPIIRS